MSRKKGPRDVSKPRPGKKAPPKPQSLAAEVPRKLTDKDLESRKNRLAEKMVEMRATERRKKNATKNINAQLSELRAECDKLAEEIVHGMEMVKQGDLFAPGVEAKREAMLKGEGNGKSGNGNGKGTDAALPKDQAAKTLAKVATAAGDVPTTKAGH